ncbi:MAG: hypothetical protein Q9164_003929 [Protoblastenia rupestris]
MAFSNRTSRYLKDGLQLYSQSQGYYCLAPATACRFASGLSKGDKRVRDQPKSKKKTRTEFINQSLKDAQQFSLCDAMRYIRAFEVGRTPTSSKYDLAVRLRTPKNGPTVRNRLRLPHAVDTSTRVCVICPPDSPLAKQAIAAGAILVGEEMVFSAVKEGRIEFDRCVCHIDSAQKLNQAQLGRILGPRGLMPSTKLGTITKDITGTVKNMVGGSEYREKLGVVRCAVGQLGFTPEEMQRNVRAFVGGIKKDIVTLSDRISKEIHEVVSSVALQLTALILTGGTRS